MSDDLTDCSEVIAQVYSFLDGELPDLESDRIRLHLAACEHCLDHFDVEAALKALVKRCCAAERAPDSLRLRVVTSLSTTSGPLTRVAYTSIEVRDAGA